MYISIVRMYPTVHSALPLFALCVSLMQLLYRAILLFCCSAQRVRGEQLFCCVSLLRIYTHRSTYNTVEEKEFPAPQDRNRENKRNVEWV